MATNIARKNFADLQYNIDSLTMDNDLRYYTRASETPDLMISADEIFKSTAGSLENFHMCYDVEFMMSHEITADNTSPFISVSGALRGSFVVVYMPTGSYVPTIKKYIANGILVKAIVITKMGIVGQGKNPIRAMSFEECFICNLKECRDIIKFDFRFNRHNDEFNIYDQTGQNTGKVAANFDWKTWAVGDGS